MGALISYPKLGNQGTVHISQNNESLTDLHTERIIHENTSFEEGYATLAVRVVNLTADTYKFYLGLYYGGDIDREFDYLLEDKDGNTSFSGSKDITFSLNRQDFWTLHEGFMPKVIKTGTNGSPLVYWRVLYR